MQELVIILLILAAMVAMGIWESSIEGRNAWDKKKYGWKIKIGNYIFLTRYHFFLFYVMIPLLLCVPLAVSGWNLRLFGILLSALAIGMSLEDFSWYVFNTEVKLKEFWTSFSDYYPWLRVGGRKIIPVGYVASAIIAMASWYFLWR